MTRSIHDVVIAGGGHNGLAAVAYLARAGRSVLLPERDHHLGGAAVSAAAFDGVAALLSRNSCLVSLPPQRIIVDLVLERRRYCSYAPDPGGTAAGLLLGHGDPDASRAPFARLNNDVVRGMVATDALIGAFTSLADPSLAANRCFLYHVIGNETGDWDVPLGGLGAVTGELERAAREAGTELRTGALVTAVPLPCEVY